MLISVTIGLCSIVMAFAQDEWESLCFHFEDCKRKEELPALFHPLFENEPHAPCLNVSIREYIGGESLVSLKFENLILKGIGVSFLQE